MKKTVSIILLLLIAGASGYFYYYRDEEIETNSALEETTKNIENNSEENSNEKSEQTPKALAPVGYITEVDGFSFVLDDNGSTRLNEGALLYEGDKVNTLKGATLTIILGDDSIIRLGEQTSYVIDFVGETETKTSLNRGTIWGRILKPVGNSSSVKVDTEDISLAVRGTSFLMEYSSKDKTTELSVVDSYVEGDDASAVVTDTKTNEEIILKEEEKVIKKRNRIIRKEKVEVKKLYVSRPFVKESTKKDIVYMSKLVSKVKEDKVIVNENLIRKINGEIQKSAPKKDEVEIFFENIELINSISGDTIEKQVLGLLVKDEFITAIREGKKDEKQKAEADKLINKLLVVDLGNDANLVDLVNEINETVKNRNIRNKVDTKLGINQEIQKPLFESKKINRKKIESINPEEKAKKAADRKKEILAIAAQKTKAAAEEKARKAAAFEAARKAVVIEARKAAEEEIAKRKRLDEAESKRFEYEKQLELQAQEEKLAEKNRLIAEAEANKAAEEEAARIEEQEKLDKAEELRLQEEAEYLESIRLLNLEESQTGSIDDEAAIQSAKADAEEYESNALDYATLARQYANKAKEFANIANQIATLGAGGTISIEITSAIQSSRDAAIASDEAASNSENAAESAKAKSDNAIQATNLTLVEGYVKLVKDYMISAENAKIVAKSKKDRARHHSDLAVELKAEADAILASQQEEAERLALEITNAASYAEEARSFANITIGYVEEASLMMTELDSTSTSGTSIVIQEVEAANLALNQTEDFSNLAISSADSAEEASLSASNSTNLDEVMSYVIEAKNQKKQAFDAKVGAFNSKQEVIQQINNALQIIEEQSVLNQQAEQLQDAINSANTYVEEAREFAAGATFHSNRTEWDYALAKSNTTSGGSILEGLLTESGEFVGQAVESKNNARIAYENAQESATAVSQAQDIESALSNLDLVKNGRDLASLEKDNALNYRNNSKSLLIEFAGILIGENLIQLNDLGNFEYDPDMQYTSGYGFTSTQTQDHIPYYLGSTNWNTNWGASWTSFFEQ